MVQGILNKNDMHGNSKPTDPAISLKLNLKLIGGALIGAGSAYVLLLLLAAVANEVFNK